MASEVLGVHIEKKNDGVLQAIKYVRGKLELLDQVSWRQCLFEVASGGAVADDHLLSDLLFEGLNSSLLYPFFTDCRGHVG